LHRSNEANSAVNSTAVTLTVLPVPGGYAGAVVADNPTAYWRLGETSGTVAHDFFMETTELITYLPSVSRAIQNLIRHRGRL